MRLPALSAFISRWPLLGLAALLAVIVITFLALVWFRTDPAGAQDDYEPDLQPVAKVWDYARETQHRSDLVARWMRVLKNLGAVADMTAAEARDYSDRSWERRDPIAAELAEIERSTAEPNPPAMPDPAAPRWSMGRPSITPGSSGTMTRHEASW